MSENIQHEKLIIIGSGPAGYTAAIYAARANLNPLLITGMEQGGQLMTTSEIENWPADVNGAQGPDLMQRFMDHAERFGTRIEFDVITAAHLKEKPIRLEADSGKTFTCDALIIATGASAKYLGLESETRYKGRGVSACATCDGFFYRKKPVAVVGGGNTALEDALYLAKICGSVTLVHRRESFRGERRLAKAVQGHPNIRILYNATVTEIRGDETVNAVLIRDGKTGTVTPVGASAIFIAIGYEPENRMFSPPVRLDKAGYILAGEDCRTGVQGVFAAGDCRTKPLRQIVTATADGAVAAFQAGAYLSAEEEKKG